MMLELGWVCMLINEIMAGAQQKESSMPLEILGGV